MKQMKTFSFCGSEPYEIHDAKAREDLAKLRDAVTGSVHVDDYKALAAMVGAGYISDILTAGDQVNVQWADSVDSTNYTAPLDVVHMADVEIQGGAVAHGLFLQHHFANKYSVCFDAPEALYDCPDGLVAGTYHFILANNRWDASLNGKKYQFTLTKDVPAGGQICLSNADAKVLVGKEVYVYGSNTSYTKLETVTLSEGNGGTLLGTSDATGDVNCYQRVQYGYNRWKNSALRQYLNSKEAAGAWWTSQNKWDRAPNNLNSVPGFMTGFSDDFLAALKPVKVVTCTNTVTDGGVEDVTYDTFFLPSLEQMCVAPQVRGKEGVAWDYYKAIATANGLNEFAQYDTYVDLIKYSLSAQSTARTCFLRSALRSNSYCVWNVTTSGFVYSPSAYYGSHAAPACVIAEEPKESNE